MRTPRKQRYLTLPTVDIPELEGPAVGVSWSVHIVRRNMNRRHTVVITAEHNYGETNPNAILNVTAEGPWWLCVGWRSGRCRAGARSDNDRSGDREGPLGQEVTCTSVPLNHC